MTNIATILTTSLAKTDEWIEGMMSALGTDRPERAYHALCAGLHALRDRISVEEVAQFGSQLPLVLRGAYYEGWHPAHKPLKERRGEDFLEHIADEIPGFDPEAVARAVFAVASNHVSAGEIEDVVGQLPSDVRALWAESVPRPGA